MIERLRKRNDKGIATSRGRRFYTPRARIERRLRRRPDLEYPAVLILQRQAVLVAPFGTDHERDRTAGTERAPHLFVRQDAGFHTSGIEERGEPRVRGIPELVVERQERAFDFAVIRPEQLHVRNTSGACHRP